MKNVVIKGEIIKDAAKVSSADRTTNRKYKGFKYLFRISGVTMYGSTEIDAFKSDLKDAIRAFLLLKIPFYFKKSDLIQFVKDNFIKGLDWDFDEIKVHEYPCNFMFEYPNITKVAVSENWTMETIVDNDGITINNRPRENQNLNNI